jgi:hypothetical protein
MTSVLLIHKSKPTITVARYKLDKNTIECIKVKYSKELKEGYKLVTPKEAKIEKTGNKRESTKRTSKRGKKGKK